MVISDRGIVATSQTLASQAGAQVLARGGSAMDAAIAANATLGVVEPESSGIGGDLFAIYWEAKTGKLTAINASGWAPKGLTIDAPETQGNTAMPQEGIHSVTVPGCVDGWAKLHKRSASCPGRTSSSPPSTTPNTAIPVTEIIHEAWKSESRQARRRRERPAASSCPTASAPQARRDLPQSAAGRGAAARSPQAAPRPSTRGADRQSHPAKPATAWAAR